MTGEQLKTEARKQLRGNWGWAILLSFLSWLLIYVFNDVISFATEGQDRIYWLINGIFSNGPVEESPLFEIWSIVITFLTSVITWGVTYTILHFRDTGQKTGVWQGIFSGFTNGRFENTFLGYLLTYIFTALWSLLLIFPGIMKAYSYSMTAYILKDMLDAGHKPTATEPISKSCDLMKGHKMDLFLLDLSFIGWFILGLITAGIGFLWVVPYYRQTRANFYRDLAGDQFKK